MGVPVVVTQPIFLLDASHAITDDCEMNKPVKKAKRPPTVPNVEGLKATMRQAEPPEEGLDLLELQPTSCRYVLNDAAPWRFCGRQKQEGSSMCDQHHSRCYVKPGSQRRARSESVYHSQEAAA